MNFETAKLCDGELLAELRVLAMRESLKQVGRFCPIRVRERFLSRFSPENTIKLIVDDRVVAFYVLFDQSDHLFLDHLYVHPDHQGKHIGVVIEPLAKLTN